jgi:hypothetical protein
VVDAKQPVAVIAIANFNIFAKIRYVNPAAMMIAAVVGIYAIPQINNATHHAVGKPIV